MLGQLQVFISLYLPLLKQFEVHVVGGLRNVSVLVALQLVNLLHQLVFDLLTVQHSLLNEWFDLKQRLREFHPHLRYLVVGHFQKLRVEVLKEELQGQLPGSYPAEVDEGLPHMKRVGLRVLVVDLLCKRGPPIEVVLVGKNLNQALARSLPESSVAALYVSHQHWHQRIVYLGNVEKMQALGEVVQKRSVLSPQAHHGANILVVVLQLWQQLLVNELAFVFRKYYVL